MRPLTTNRLVSLTLLTVLILLAALVRFDQIPSTCPFYRITGVPCPFCKMTSSWSQIMHGQPITGFKTNPLGALLLLFAAGPFIYLIIALLFRRPKCALPKKVGQKRWIIGSFIFIWLANWLYVVCRFYR